MRNEATIKSMVCVNIDSPSPTDNLGVVALRGAFLGELIGVGIPDARRPPPVLVLPVSMSGMKVKKALPITRVDGLLQV